MSYVTDQFQAGQVHIFNDICGWYFNETDEFRPLMADAMYELFDAGLVTQAHLDATETARYNHVQKTLAAYTKSQDEFWNDPKNEDAQREQLAEMRAAFGPGEEVVNAITGRRTKL